MPKAFSMNGIQIGPGPALTGGRPRGKVGVLFGLPSARRWGWISSATGSFPDARR
jgi:hypothetical protein